VCENVLADGDVVVEDVVSVLDVMCGMLSQDQDGWQSGVDTSGHYWKGGSGRVRAWVENAVAITLQASGGPDVLSAGGP
jgi:hypothetical protein